MLAFLAVFFYYSGQHMLRVRSIGQVTPVMVAPMWLTYLAMPVGSASDVPADGSARLAAPCGDAGLEATLAMDLQD